MNPKLLQHLSSVAHRLQSDTSREFMAETVGTFILVLMGNGAVAQVVLSGGSKGDFFSINVGYALAVYLAVLVSGGISGGHINPAVSVAMALFNKFPWPKVPVYLVAQYIGAFFGSVILYFVYINALDTYDPGRTLASAAIFATYPGAVANNTGYLDGNFLTSGNGIGDQILGSLILLMCVCAINDARNIGLSRAQGPFAVAAVVFSIGLSLGLNCGYAINPARDLGPRLFTLVAGWGSAPFTATTSDGVQWWWVPVVGSHIGAILGVASYKLLVEVHYGNEKELYLEADRRPTEFEVTTISAGRNGTFIKTIDSNKVCPESGATPNVPTAVD